MRDYYSMTMDAAARFTPDGYATTTAGAAEAAFGDLYRADDGRAFGILLRWLDAIPIAFVSRCDFLRPLDGVAVPLGIVALYLRWRGAAVPEVVTRYRFVQRPPDVAFVTKMRRLAPWVEAAVRARCR